MRGRGRGLAFVLACVGVAVAPVPAAISTASPPSFAAARTYATGSGPVAVATGDLTGDGKPDLAITNSGDDTVSVLANSGRGKLGDRRDYATEHDAESVALADLDGDGDNDLAVANGLSDSVSVLLNSGDGNLQPRADYTTGQGPVSVATGDLNGDTGTDLAVANLDASTVSVLLNGGHGSFTAKTDYRVGNTPTSVAVGDINADGALDIATSNLRADTISVLIGRGDGAFEPKRDYRTGGAPISVAIGDLNGDRKLDLAAADRGPYTDSPGWVSVLINAGDGGFATKRDYRIGGGPESVAIGDLNGDRRRDIATADPYANNRGVDAVSVIANRGGGSFRPKIDYRVGRSPIFVTARDLNGDRKLDLVAANTVGDTVSVLGNLPGRCTVQRVDGMTLPSAKPRIRRANCRVGRIRHAYSQILDEGRVIAQRPAWGAVLRGGRRVELVVSLGAKK